MVGTPGIAVIGAGVCGLSTAIRLLEAGYVVTILSDRRTPHTTSDRSAAVFTPMPETLLAGDDVARVRRWTQDSVIEFRRLSKEHPVSGVSLAPRREFVLHRMPCDDWWRDLVDDYRRLEPREVGAPYCDGHAARVPVMNMLRYMPWLESRFESLGGRFAMITLRSLDDPALAGFPIVVNCSGLGARQLAGDAAMIPMRGQVLHVRNDWGLAEALVDEGVGPIGAYVFPFDDHMVLGGTYQIDNWSETVCQQDRDGIVSRCKALLHRCGHDVPGDFGARPLRAWAGLRPLRRVGPGVESVRLETALLPDRRLLVHNYGHGRCGVTLSWGCAADVSERVGPPQAVRR